MNFKMLPAIAENSERARAMWRACLVSAFRTALACIIVGCVTVYGPANVQRLIGFPAFSYVTAILIINDATLGDTLRGCWLALYATIQSIGPAILSLWVIGPSRFSKGTISLAVAFAAFVVALPGESTHLIAKRLALGEIVIVYVTAYADGDHTEPVMHPIRLAVSTAVGVLACVLALLLPCPRLACHEVKQSYELLIQNTLERLKLYVKAICEEDKACALASISHAMSLATQRPRLLQIITRYQDGMKWEKPSIKNFRPKCSSRAEKLQEVDIILRGMEMALKSIESFPVSILDEELKSGLNRLEEYINLTITQAKPYLHSASTIPEPTAKTATKFLQSLDITPKIQDLPIYFFLFCAKLLHKKSLPESSVSLQDKWILKNEYPSNNAEKWIDWTTALKGLKLIPAFKCSLSLGLAALLGLIYSKKDGFWSGLPVALSFVSSRDTTFRAANVKAQGTVLGTVYGVLAWFVFEKYMPIRFLSLLPWLIFTCFLQRSRMYGPAGGISTLIGAILILGRKNFGPPSEFAAARIVETFIGLSCSILVDLLFKPKRASIIAKTELCASLGTLHQSIRSLSLLAGKNELEDSQEKFKKHVNELRKFIAEAEVEPNFWFVPFHSACYNKLLESLSKMVDLLHFESQALKILQQEIQRNEALWKRAADKLECELGFLKEIICSSIKCFEEISRMKSLRLLSEKELEDNNTFSLDLESGKTPKSNICIVNLSEDDIEETLGSYLEHVSNAVDEVYANEGELELKSQFILSLSALGFCICVFMRETTKIEEAMKELLQWENPSREINLYDKSCKLHALYQ